MTFNQRRYRFAHITIHTQMREKRMIIRVSIVFRDEFVIPDLILFVTFDSAKRQIEIATEITSDPRLIIDEDLLKNVGLLLKASHNGIDEIDDLLTFGGCIQLDSGHLDLRLVDE